MNLHVIACAIVLHFTCSHSLLALFHCTAGRKWIYPYVKRFAPLDFQFAYCVPYDICFTATIVSYTDLQKDWLHATYESLPLSLSVTALSEIRVLFYTSVPKHVSCLMFIVRSVVTTVSNAMAFYASMHLIR